MQHQFSGTGQRPVIIDETSDGKHSDQTQRGRWRGKGNPKVGQHQQRSQDRQRCADPAARYRRSAVQVAGAGCPNPAADRCKAEVEPAQHEGPRQTNAKADGDARPNGKLSHPAQPPRKAQTSSMARQEWRMAPSMTATLAATPGISMLKSKTLCAAMAKTITRPKPATLDFLCHQSPEQDHDHGPEGIDVRDQTQYPLLDVKREVGAVGLGPDLLGEDRIFVHQRKDNLKVTRANSEQNPLSPERCDLLVDREPLVERAVDIAHPVDPGQCLQREKRERPPPPAEAGDAASDTGSSGHRAAARPAGRKPRAPRTCPDAIGSGSGAA